MKKERRELEDWEKQECAALKAAIADFNAGKPREKRVTQEELAHELKMSQGTLNSHLNGGRPLSKEMAAKIYLFMGIPASRYSHRLAEELEDLAKAVPQPSQTTIDQAPLGAGAQAIGLMAVASERSRKILERIAIAADQGRLTEEDLALLGSIAERFEARAPATERPPLPNAMQKQRDALRGNKDPSE
ncbi:helix-turn-helix transcriptional regulator [Pseudomonas sp. PDM21]|uniref:helix-turn-helix domain-containing protein n=1 Tax=Pseudomonas sp. PDM21 TaxID=2769257 RepID=UPI00177D06EA|nr:helix-turn-helix transcriptional regulator [Pseudomonas sp. PDM21]MBD9671602.1 helix-turn-helix transcriptional regulator [Pseudomonas sp. PDM21]